MSQQLLLSLTPDVTLIEAEPLVLRSPQHSLTIQQPRPGLQLALQSLANGGATLTQLGEMVQQSAEDYAMLKFYAYLQKFSQLGWLRHSVGVAGLPIATVAPSAASPLSSVEVNVAQSYRLSRFAYCHWVDGQLVLESPLSSLPVRLLHWQGAALVSQLAQPCNCQELVAQIPGIALATAQQFISLLASAQLLTEVSEEGTTQEEANTTLAQWEFHDLMFHRRSRAGKLHQPLGATYRFKGKIEPLPALKPPMSAEVIELYKPDLEALKTNDLPFTQILETRKSIRHYGDPAIAAPQLGEFLYRCARVKHLVNGDRGEFAYRPYPSGGALYELELYPVINTCEGIATGLYHYQPLAHQLCHLSGRTDPVEALLREASWSMGQPEQPQVLIIIAARFQRLAWKYEAIAYALMLKHVGALYQTMYLVATSMGLAPCGLGSGNSDLFTSATGTDYYIESSVGEFALGSRAGQGVNL
jgi:oxazoline/thiazoline dehydrogenase